METVRLSPEEFQILLRMVQPEALEQSQLFQRVTEILAALSHQPAFVMAPTVKHSTVKQIELFPIGVQKLLCVLVAQEAMVASHVIEVEEPMSRDEATSLAHFLNTELAGLPIQELLTSLERRLLAVNDSFYHLIKRSLLVLQTALATEPEERFLCEGTMYLFECPEFRRDPKQAHELLRQLEFQTDFLKCLREDLASEGTRVRIGREVAINGLEDCSYIVSPFGVQRSMVGAVGVLGPKRMRYSRMRALTEGMAELVTNVLTRWEAAR